MSKSNHQGDWSPETEARVQGVCATILVAFLALGIWAYLIAAGVAPAMPWSPIGQAQQNQDAPVHLFNPDAQLDPSRVRQA